MRLFSNRSQVTSKCGKSIKVAHEAIAECVIDVLTTFWRPLWSIYWTDARQHGIYLFYTIKKYTTSGLYFKIFLNYSKAGLCPLWQTRIKAIWRNLLSIQNEAISLSTADWDCSSIFSEPFSKKETAFSYFFLLLVPVQCLDKAFLYFFFSQSRKILSYFSKLSAILKCRRKNFVLMTSIVCLSSDRLYARITWFIV